MQHQSLYPPQRTDRQSRRRRRCRTYFFASCRGYRTPRGRRLSLVEKPLAKDLDQCKELNQLALDRNLLLQVGHIERFNPAYEELVKTGLTPRYIVCKRTSSFPGRSLDVGVVLDLMIHDLDLVLDLVKDTPTQVEAFGAAIMGGCEDMAQVRIHFPAEPWWI